MKITTQEFRVLCTRAAGTSSPPRKGFLPATENQDREQRLVYAKGRGATLASRRKGARRVAKEIMGCMGWDRFTTELTIADEELANAEFRDQYLRESGE